jgi:hypothetical protein
MAEGPNSANLVFGGDCERCPVTGRHYEQGSGALEREAQTANFVRERDRLADMPKPGERCPQTGREYECGPGAQTKRAQTARVLSELPPAEKEKRAAAMFALAEAMPAGQA